MRIRRDVGGDFDGVQVHHTGIGEWRYVGGAGAAGRASGAQDVRPRIASVARRYGSGATFGPYPGQRALLADAGFVLPPELQRLAAGVLGQGPPCQQR